MDFLPWPFEVGAAGGYDADGGVVVAVGFLWRELGVGCVLAGEAIGAAEGGKDGAFIRADGVECGGEDADEGIEGQTAEEGDEGKHG